MTKVGRWSPNKIRKRVMDSTWPDANSSTGLCLIPPVTISYGGTAPTASVNENGSVLFTDVSYITALPFTSTYSNYLINIRLTSSAATGDPYIYLGNSGSTSSTGWTYQYLYATSSTLSAARTGGGTSPGAYIGDSAGSNVGIQLYLYGPYLAQPTAFRSIAMADNGSGALIDYAGTHNVSTSYSGIGVAPYTGTITGLMSIYGFGE